MVFEKEQLIAILKEVKDPELGLDVWTLGLIYDFIIRDQFVGIKMTFTSPMCPFGPQMVEEIKLKIKEKAPEYTVDIDIVFTPPWQPSDEVREMLGV